MRRFRSGEGTSEKSDRLVVRDHVVRRMRELVEGSFMAGIVDIPEEGKRSAINGDLIVLTPEDIESASVGCGDLLATFVLTNISQSWSGWNSPQEVDEGIRGILSTATDDLGDLRDMAQEWEGDRDRDGADDQVGDQVAELERADDGGAE